MTNIFIIFKIKLININLKYEQTNNTYHILDHHKLHQIVNLCIMKVLIINI